MSQEIAKVNDPQGMVTDLSIAMTAITQGKFFCARVFVEDVLTSLQEECKRQLKQDRELV
jgi:hypothetical protein